MVCSRHWSASVRISQSPYLPSAPAPSWCLMSQLATTLPLGWTGILYQYRCHWLIPAHFSFEFLCLFSASLNYVSPRHRKTLQGINGWAPTLCGGVTSNLLLALGLHLSYTKISHKVVFGLTVHGLGASTRGLRLLLRLFFPTPK